MDLNALIPGIVSSFAGVFLALWLNATRESWQRKKEERAQVEAYLAQLFSSIREIETFLRGLSEGNLSSTLNAQPAVIIRHNLQLQPTPITQVLTGPQCGARGNGMRVLDAYRGFYNVQRIQQSIERLPDSATFDHVNNVLNRFVMLSGIQ